MSFQKNPKGAVYQNVIVYDCLQLIEELGLKVLGDDYDKCFSGHCLTCNAPPRGTSKGGPGPHINVSYVSGAAANAGGKGNDGGLKLAAQQSSLDHPDQSLKSQSLAAVDSATGGIMEFGATLTLGVDRGLVYMFGFIFCQGFL